MTISSVVAVSKMIVVVRRTRRRRRRRRRRKKGRVALKKVCSASFAYVLHCLLHASIASRPSSLIMDAFKGVRLHRAFGRLGDRALQIESKMPLAKQ